MSEKGLPENCRRSLTCLNGYGLATALSNSTDGETDSRKANMKYNPGQV